MQVKLDQRHRHKHFGTFRTNGGLVWPFFYTAVFYLVFVGVLTILFNWLEKKLNYFRV